VKISSTTPPLYNPTIYKKAAKYIADHKKVQTFLQKFEANTGLYSSVLAFLVGTTLKPATLVAIPNKEKEDTKYAVARSLSTAIADLGLAGLVFIPLKKGLDAGARRLHNAEGTIYHNNPDACTRFKSIFNRSFKIAGIPMFAWTKFALIPVLAKLYEKNKNNKNNNRVSKRS